VYDAFHILGYQLHTDDLKWGYLIGLSINLIFDTLWEVLYVLEKYKDSLTEKELATQTHTAHEFELLKSQVNPHFLFNCFNTLSSLIQEDKEEAEHFLDELSKVYRYLLKNNEDSISMQLVAENMKGIIYKKYKQYRRRHYQYIGKYLVKNTLGCLLQRRETEPYKKVVLDVHVPRADANYEKKGIRKSPYSPVG